MYIITNPCIYCDIKFIYTFIICIKYKGGENSPRRK